jgi:hypothetical protein
VSSPCVWGGGAYAHLHGTLCGRCLFAPCDCAMPGVESTNLVVTFVAVHKLIYEIPLLQHPPCQLYMFSRFSWALVRLRLCNL